MAHHQPIVYRNPPLAGRPPFASIEPDDHFDQQPMPQQRRIRQQPHPDPNSRTSAYNVYDNYLDEKRPQSGVGALGMGFMNGHMDEDEDDEDGPSTYDSKHAALAAAVHPSRQQPNSIPLASPRPGYPSNPVHALTSIARPSPIPTRDPGAPEMSQVSVLRRGIPPPAPIAVPSTPHPLQPPMTPITPVFARPHRGTMDTASMNGSVQFETSHLRPQIIRGSSEEALLPRRGEKGDDFWRRFSMVAKTEKSESVWLKKTQNGTTRLSRWVWLIGVAFLVAIAGGIALGWYISHKSPSGNTAPKAIGGSADQYATSSSVAPTGASSSFHVSPTFTVAKRDAGLVMPTSVVVLPLAHRRRLKRSYLD